VVDDGSTDQTAKAAEAYSGALAVTVLKHTRNLGLGAALLTGLRHAVKTCGHSEVVVVMDADNTHDPSQIVHLLERIGPEHDLVIASRFCAGSQVHGVSALRRFLSLGASVLMRLAFRIPEVRDYTSGYRAYAADLLQSAFAVYGDRLVEETGFTSVVEILVKIAPLSRGIAEVPLALRYDLKEGSSKMRILRTVWRYLTLVSRQPKSWSQSSLPRGGNDAGE
jgi:dolichol-phosphate mannosyltransferase